MPLQKTYNALGLGWLHGNLLIHSESYFCTILQHGRNRKYPLLQLSVCDVSLPALTDLSQKAPLSQGCADCRVCDGLCHPAVRFSAL